MSQSDFKRQRKRINDGQLCRNEFREAVYAIGQGTDHETVAAASHWEGNMENKTVRPAHPESYEHLMHLSEMDTMSDRVCRQDDSRAGVSDRSRPCPLG